MTFVPDKQHMYSFSNCPECRKRGVNNRTEVRGWPDNIPSCETCFRFRAGELDRDHPELKLFIGKTPISPPSQPQPVIHAPISAQKIESSEHSQLVEELITGMDETLKAEVLECIMEDKDIVARVLSDSRYFSLKELRRHRDRIIGEEPEIDLEKKFESMAPRRKQKATKGRKPYKSRRNIQEALDKKAKELLESSEPLDRQAP